MSVTPKMTYTTVPNRTCCSVQATQTYRPLSHACNLVFRPANILARFRKSSWFGLKILKLILGAVMFATGLVSVS